MCSAIPLANVCCSVHLSLSLDSLPPWNGVVLMSWTYVIHFFLILSLISTCTIFDCQLEIAIEFHCKLVINETK